MKKIFTILAIALINLVSFAQHKDLQPGIYAEFNTNKGVILCQLEYQKVPMTVANFVGLAEGNFTFQDTLKYNTPFYNGLKFHRVISNFMIQGGDPSGNGSGGPKYRFYDEIDTTLKHKTAGVLSMANAGPNTNGSQFFITHVPTPWLDGKHAVFGHVISGQDIVNAIAQNDTMKSVKIIRIGKDAKNWDATKAFNDVYNKKKAEIAEKEAYIKKIDGMSNADYSKMMFDEIKVKYPNAVLSKSGLVYIIENNGAEHKTMAGDTCILHYRGVLRKDGKLFDSSYDRGAPIEFVYLTNRMIPGFEEGVAMLGKGGKAKLFIPYYAAYGKREMGGVIPAYSDLIFDIELVDLKTK